jgi:hypothetical protein
LCIEFPQPSWRMFERLDALPVEKCVKVCVCLAVSCEYLLARGPWFVA